MPGHIEGPGFHLLAQPALQAQEAPELDQRIAAVLRPYITHFSQPDSIIPPGVQGYDRYAYVNNNPISHNDPSGHCGFDTIGGELGATIVNCVSAATKAVNALSGGNRNLAALAVDFSGLQKVVQSEANAIAGANSDVALLKSSNGSVLERAGAAGHLALFGLSHAAVIVGTVQLGAEVVAGEKAVSAVASEAGGMPSEGPVGVPCSFSPDTFVATAKGEKPIGSLKEGDYVLAYNKADGTQGYYAIKAVLVHSDKVLTEVILDGEHIETTPNHPFYTQEKGWVDAGELHLGMHVRKADGTYGLVWWVWNVTRTQTMYNLTVDTAHTYFVGNGQWLVHNKCGPDISATGPHSTFTRDPETGEINHYATYEPQTNPQNPNPWEEVLRYDGEGAAHFNKVFDLDIETPHVHDPSWPGGARWPWEDEIP